MDHIRYIESKIFRDAGGFEPRLAKWKNRGLKIVFTNGCFDLIHRGHVEYLAKAADRGDRLVVGLNSDNSVYRLKGAGRPYMEQTSRAFVLAALHSVSAVVIFNGDTPESLIDLIRPDFLIKGSDYSVSEIAGSRLVLSYGGKVETIDLVPGFSTSLLAGKIINHGK